MAASISTSFFSPYAFARPKTGSPNKPFKRKTLQKPDPKPKFKTQTSRYKSPPDPIILSGSEATTYTRLPPKEDFPVPLLIPSSEVKLSDSAVAKIDNEIEDSNSEEEEYDEQNGDLGLNYGKFEIFEGTSELEYEGTGVSGFMGGESVTMHDKDGNSGLISEKFEVFEGNSDLEYEEDDDDFQEDEEEEEEASGFMDGRRVNMHEEDGTYKGIVKEHGVSAKLYVVGDDDGPMFGFDDGESVNFSANEGDYVEGENEMKEKGVPAVMRCFDRAKIYAKAGDGGNGVVAFRREKYVPLGGPSGGDGGRGGNVFVEVDGSMNSLLPFRNRVHFRAGRGSHGKGRMQDGAKGEDVVFKVAPGTVIREAGKEEVLLELLYPGQRALLLPGGRGGRGNASFKSGANKVPRIAENGEIGPEM